MHHSVITFDGLSYPVLNPECEYILTRHNNASDNFAVTVKEAGKVMSVYLNDTKYSLSSDGLKVNGLEEYMPYKRKHVIYIRQVNVSGQTYVRITAWSGIDIYYGRAGQVQVSIDGFYMNQTAGLCSNANYNNNRNDELQGPCGPVDTIKKFVSSWTVNCLSPTLTTSVPSSSPNWDKATKKCRRILNKVAAAAYPVLDYEAYLEVCIDDVAHGRPANLSIDAYTMALALASKEVALSMFHYYFDKHHIIMNVNCSSSGFNPRCERKAHEKFQHGSKKCETLNKVTVCIDGCQPERSTHPQQIEAFCSNSNDDSSKKENSSPSYVFYEPIIRCK